MNSEKPIIGDRSAYYTQAASWSQDVIGSVQASRRRAYIVAGIAVFIAALEAIALTMLIPLKTVVPYTITVDRQTGYIQTAQGIQTGALSQDQAVINSFIAQYVIARESFDVTDIQNNYREIAAWTAGPARDQYIRAMQKTNPQAPENLFDSNTVLKITVKSISLLSRISALVRFDAERSSNGGTPTSRTPYTAVIGFQFTGAPLRAEDRLLNPLGFQVTAYRRDSDTPDAAANVQVAP